jgi:hypothetical protein
MKVDQRWICPLCLKKVSVRHDSIFFNSSLSLKQIIKIIFHFWNKDTIDRTAEEIEANYNSVLHWFSKLKLVIISNMLKTDNSIGGENSIVEIDEACLRRRKNRKGKCKKEIWVIGGIERNRVDHEKRKMFLEVLTDRSADSLLTE